VSGEYWLTIAFQHTCTCLSPESSLRCGCGYYLHVAFVLIIPPSSGQIYLRWTHRSIPRPLKSSAIRGLLWHEGCLAQSPPVVFKVVDDSPPAHASHGERYHLRAHVRWLALPGLGVVFQSQIGGRKIAARIALPFSSRFSPVEVQRRHSLRTSIQFFGSVTCRFRLDTSIESIPSRDILTIDSGQSFSRNISQWCRACVFHAGHVLLPSDVSDVRRFIDFQLLLSFT
jgi:hypothetical protein